MSARKLSRLAGLVFVLAAIVGGVGAVSSSAQHGSGVSASSATTQSIPGDVVWG